MKKIILALSFVTFAPAIFAYDFENNSQQQPQSSTTQVYNNSGTYQGQVNRDSDGSKYYGPNGEYRGEAKSDGFGGYNYYGRNGEYKGTSKTSNY